MNKQKTGVMLIVLIAVVSIAAAFLYGPVPQDLGYHDFSDSLTLFHIPNFWNVVSNIPYLLVGLLALYYLFLQKLILLEQIKAAYIIFFIGISLVALGSGYYHIWPQNQTLVWDRLPMTIAFMALYSIIVSEFVSVRLGKILLLPLLILGVSSIVYWHITEQMGQGDLRFYAVVQFFPMLTIPVILLFFSSRFSHVSGYWLLLLSYLAAKVFEHYDYQIHSLLSFMSGHSIKHIISAVGVYLLLSAYRQRHTL